MKRMFSDPERHTAAAVAGTLRLGAALSALAHDATSTAAVGADASGAILRGAMRDEDPAGMLARANANWPGISDMTPAALE